MLLRVENFSLRVQNLGLLEDSFSRLQYDQFTYCDQECCPNAMFTHHQVAVKYVQLNHQLLYTGKASDYYTYEVRDGWTLTLTNFRAWFISLVMPVESK